MKVLAIYRHYWPDTTPYANLLRMILERLAEDGHDVTVLSGQPSYNAISTKKHPNRDYLGGVKIRRFALIGCERHRPLIRSINTVWFMIRAMVHATISTRYDLVLANSQPPVLIGMVLRCLAWLTGCKTVLHVQDIHPEALAAIGKSGLLFRLLRHVDARSCHTMDRLVTLSSDMEKSLRNRSMSPANISVINNCPPRIYEEEIAIVPVTLGSRSDTKFLFAGNLGRFQALPELAAATRKISYRPDLKISFMGAGTQLQATRAAASPQITRFLPRQPLSVANAAMAEADYGIVSLAPTVIEHAYPSKTLAYLAAGLPLLLIAEPTSELAQMIVQEKLGIVAASTNPNDIADAIDEAIARKPEWTANRRAAIAEFAQQRFGSQKMLDAWSQIIHDVDVEKTTMPHQRALQRGAAA